MFEEPAKSVSRIGDAHVSAELRRIAFGMAYLVVCSASGRCFCQTTSENSGRARGVVVEDLRNEQPSFMVRVAVDHEDCIYAEGEEIKVYARSAKSGYLYLFYRNAEGHISCIFPNRVQSENRINKDTTVLVPANNSQFRLRVGSPFGKELLKAIVTSHPIKELDEVGLTDRDSTSVEDRVILRALDALRRRPHEWAEHDVEMATLAQRRTPRRTKRIGVFIGISEFKSSRDLSVCHKDAMAMQAAMKEKGKLDESFLLVNREATLSAIENLIRRKLPSITGPSDTIFFFWSGHGGRCPDNDGDEEDGYDEFLVPYDGGGNDIATVRRTMLMDDTFGRWVQELDGRKLIVILDTCCSGGQSANQKGIDGPDGIGQLARGGQSFDFFGGEVDRTKDIGQKETALLASSKPVESSFERLEGDLSVMTYFMVEHIHDHTGSLSLRDAFTYVENRVPSYVRSRVRGHTQTPVLVDYTSPPLYLVP